MIFNTFGVSKISFGVSKNTFGVSATIIFITPSTKVFRVTTIVLIVLFN